MSRGGGATWRDTAPWAYRRVDDNEERGGLRYADTLADIRTDFVEDEDAFRYEIQKRVRGDHWVTYGDLIFGPSGPVLRRGVF